MGEVKLYYVKTRNFFFMKNPFLLVAKAQDFYVRAAAREGQTRVVNNL